MLVKVLFRRKKRVEGVAAAESPAEAVGIAAELVAQPPPRTAVYAQPRRELRVLDDIVPVRLAHREGRRLRVVQICGNLDAVTARHDRMP